MSTDTRIRESNTKITYPDLLPDNDRFPADAGTASVSAVIHHNRQSPSGVY